jgi:hypothetical protein
MRRQLTHQRLARGLGNVAGHGALVAVGAQVISRLGVRALRVLQEGRPPGARVIAAARPLDLDHVGAQVGQGLGAPGAREHAGEVEDADAG